MSFSLGGQRILVPYNCRTPRQAFGPRQQPVPAMDRIEVRRPQPRIAN